MIRYRDLFKEPYPKLKRLASRYTGFKFYLLLLLCSFTVSLLVAARRAHAVPQLGTIFSFNWMEYISTFWISRPWVFGIFVLTYVTTLLLNVLEAPFKERVISIPPTTEEDDHFKRQFRRLNRYMTIFIFFAFLLVAPVIHLWLPVWYSAAAFLAGLFGAIVPAWVALVLPRARQYVNRLGQYRFRGVLSFNTASMGAEAIEVKRELSYYERLRESSPMSGRVEEYLRDGGSTDYLWQGFHQFYEYLAGFFQVPAVWITTHQNTTKAIRHALRLCRNEHAHVVMTDLEYGSVQRSVIDLFPKERRTILNFREEHLEKRLDYRAVVDEMAKQLNEMAASAPPETKFVVVISHVTYLTGAVLDVKRLWEKLKIEESRLVLIVDGAQAAGNIRVGREFIDSCDFYAASGHKWLLGKTTLGILIHVPERTYRKLGLDLEKVRHGTSPFAHIDYEVDDYTGETVDIEQMVSLNAMLLEFNAVGQDSVSEHNRELAKLFSNLVTRIRGVSVVTSPVQSGIVALRVRNEEAVTEKLERRYGFIGQGIEPDILRFSFHYFLSQRDMHSLVEALNEVVRSAQHYHED